ncbi:thioredoxin family protein [Magnetospirillum sp. UT-4]|uniref:thioredoxin family protein n=1 Tax=Magnetospirillum sp. UT-4 TaxID=2681467 RepID=UPI00138294D9|nr:thioredoxin family protein [Magnetospirillum sp. UT-4]CAA7625109.1 Putative Thioredoxin (H-type,TRX-H) (modular protein) [Magnetospirillum sp. UT-4]
MKRFVAMLFAVAVFAVAGPSLAAQPFDKQAFMQAQEAGAPILLHIHAPWCPTCKAQEPIVGMLEKENHALKVFRVDFDGQKDVVKELKVSSQSTLIAFSGKTETSRSTGVTDPAKIRAMVPKAAMMMDKPMEKPMGMDKPMMDKPMMDKKM